MFKLRYDPAVAHDLDKFDRSVQTRLLNQIKKKLTLAPLEFGKPLRYSLKGYWRLRMGDYRAVYEVDSGQKIVTVWLIDKRKDDAVYIEFLKRLKSRAL